MSSQRCNQFLRRHVIAGLVLTVPMVLWAQPEQLTVEAVSPDDDELLEQAVVTPEQQFGELSDTGYLVDRFEAREIYRGYMNNEQYAEAVDAARLGLELTVSHFGVDHGELPPYLNDLGTALARAGRPADAQEAFSRSIDIVETTAGIFSGELIEPLMGLGLVLQDMSEHGDAVAVLLRAQHVTHRSEGVYSLNQIPIIEAQAASYMVQNQWVEAENLKLLSFKLYRRKFGEESLETIPAMYRLARWYEDIHDYRQARVIYQRSLAMQEEAAGPDSIAMIPGLKGIASSYLKEHGADLGKGVRAQEQIVSIIDANTDSISQEQHVLAHLELGDWYVQINKEEDAWRHYREGWELAQRDETGERDWAEYFSQPQIIYSGAVLSVDLIGYNMIGKEVYYDFEFDVGRDGRAHNISVLDTNLHGQTRAAATQAFRYARFRPAIVGGETVETKAFRARRIYPTPALNDYSRASAELGAAASGN